jgi:RNA polymerase sigma factor (sigma-70 family)
MPSHFTIFRNNNQKFTEKEILEGVSKLDNRMISHIYSRYFSGIKVMVLGFHSLALDPEDIFQDGMVIACENIQLGKFRGDSSFNTYLTGVCRNLCLKQLNKIKKAGNTIDINDIQQIEDEQDLEELIERITLLKERMDDKCRELINLRFGLNNTDQGSEADFDNGRNLRFEVIAQNLGIEADNARKRFQRCMEKLRELVFNDSAWIDLLNSVK